MFYSVVELTVAKTIKKQHNFCKSKYWQTTNRCTQCYWCVGYDNIDTWHTLYIIFLLITNSSNVHTHAESVRQIDKGK